MDVVGKPVVGEYYVTYFFFYLLLKIDGSGDNYEKTPKKNELKLGTMFVGFVSATSNYGFGLCYTSTEYFYYIESDENTVSKMFQRILLCILTIYTQNTHSKVYGLM